MLQFPWATSLRMATGDAVVVQLRLRRKGAFASPAIRRPATVRTRRCYRILIH